MLGRIMNSPGHFAFLFAAGLVYPAVLGCLTLSGSACKGRLSANANVEKLPEVRPNLPDVPKLPPPEFDITYPDGSYSVHGLRKRLRQTMDKPVDVTATVVEVYEPPQCAKGAECDKAKMPHIWVADKAGERDAVKRLLIVGYAERHDEVATALARGKALRQQAKQGAVEGIGGDFVIGDKVLLKGTFTRISAHGFNSSEGLLDYNGHRLVQAAANP